MLLLIIILLTLIDYGNSETTESPTVCSEAPSSPGTSWSSGKSSSSSQNTEMALLGVGIGVVCIVVAILLKCAVYFVCVCVADRYDQSVTDLTSSNQGQGHQESQDLSSDPPRYSTVVTVSRLAGATGIPLSHNECSQGPDVNGTTRNQLRTALFVQTQSKKSRKSRTDEPPPSYSSLFRIEHL